MTAELEGLDLTLQQFPLIMMVVELGPVTQTDIAKRFNRPAYAISRTLDDLEQAGLIERQPHPSSRRAHNIVATPMAKTLAPTLHAMVRRVNADTLAPLSAEQQDQLMTMLPQLLAK